MSKPLIESSLTDKQLKQLEKQQRRKKYADLAIQGTNNSSIASKRSVEVLYTNQLHKTNGNRKTKEYFKYFVPKAPKRSPCINRGYWLRLHAIRSSLNMIAHDTEKEIIVINLGCGFDPLPFQMLDEDNAESRKYSKRFSFMDLDYADLIQRKAEIIRDSAELMQIIGPEYSNNSENAAIVTKQYKAIACNLNQPASFFELMQDETLTNPDLVKVFIAEVSLAYMKPEHADNIISLAAALPSSHFLILEQLIPQGLCEPFSKQMLRHFTKNDSPLQSVLKYHTKASQLQRFASLGFSSINAGDMYQLWQSLSSEQRSHITATEPFDELEEFQLFSHHYILCHAVNYEYTFANRFIDAPEPQASSQLTMPFFESQFSLERRFGSAVYDSQSDNILYFGGCNPNRVNDLILVDSETGHKTVLDMKNSPPARMCHTFSISPTRGKCIVVGGRKGPSQGFSDTWLFDHVSKQWHQGPDLPETRFRHCASFINEIDLLIFGGNTSDTPFLKFDIASKKFKECKINVSDLKLPVISAAMDYKISSNKGVIIGGSADDTEVSDTLYLFTVGEQEMKVLKQFSHPLLQRYGSKVLFLNDSEVLVVGGTSSDRLFGRHNTIILVNIETEVVKDIPIPRNLWDDHPLFLVGFEMLLVSRNEVAIIGGGATCYGFGSVSNQGFCIKF